MLSNKQYYLKNASFFILVLLLTSCGAVTAPFNAAIRLREKAQFDQAWRKHDYATATRIINDGFDIGHEINGKSLSYIAGQCKNVDFSRAVMDHGGSIDEFKQSSDQSIHRAICSGDTDVISRYFNCGYPKYSSINNKPLIYWAGFCAKDEVATILDSRGTNSESYQDGLREGRSYRIDSAFSDILLSHLSGHFFKGGNIFTAVLNETMGMARSSAIKRFYREVYPEWNSEEINTAAIVTGLFLDDKLSVKNFTEKTIRDEVKKQLNEDSPGLGTISSFVYGTLKRLDAAKNK